MTQKAPGWYPDPQDPQQMRQIYWDGTNWAGPTAPPPPTVLPPPAGGRADKSKQTAVAVGVIVLAAIGLFMTMQSVSLLTGTGSLWTGVAVTAAGTAAAFFLGAPKWVRVVASVCLVVGLFNVLYMEHELSQKRSEIREMFNN